MTSAVLMHLPTSCAIQIFGIARIPVSGSTSTSTTAAEYEYAGDGPTPAPRYRPPEGGGEYEPTVPSVPKRDSARTTASAKLMPLSGFATSKTRPPANPTLSAAISSFFDAAAT